jgi:nucleotide-binding universal stress UspA family protein
MKLLVGVNGTDHGLAALDEAIARATEAGDEVTVAVYRQESVAEPLDEIESRVRERLTAADLTADVRQLEGHVASQLVELADSEGFDRLVVPGGQRSALGKIRIGDFLEFVLLNVETTVTLVR